MSLFFNKDARRPLGQHLYEKHVFPTNAFPVNIANYLRIAFLRTPPMAASTFQNSIQQPRTSYQETVV